MSDAAELQEWTERRARMDDRLYARFGKHLEEKQAGEFVAISDGGELITGSDELRVAQLAVVRFGPGTFALRRIGADAEIRWRRF